MKLFSRDDLLALLRVERGPCVSIYLPTEIAGKETLQNPIRFKNLLRKAETVLGERGMRAAEISELVRPATALVDEFPFWQQQRRGLGVFVAPGTFRFYRVPLVFPELAMVGERFYLKPMVRLLAGDGRFRILALQRDRIRAYDSTRHTIDEIEPPDVPLRLEEVVGRDIEQPSLQRSAGGGMAQGRGAGPFPVHAGEDDAKDETRRFYQAADRGLRRAFADDPVPVVAVGGEHLVPIWREVNSLPSLVEEEVRVNPAALSDDDLRDAAWAVVAPLFDRDLRLAEERFAGLHGTGRASSETGAIVPASTDGRVDVLFIPRGRRLWGRYHAVERRVEIADGSNGHGGFDLLDFSAVQTLLHAGRVFVVEPERLPAEGCDMAAVFRF